MAESKDVSKSYYQKWAEGRDWAEYGVSNKKRREVENAVREADAEVKNDRTKRGAS